MARADFVTGCILIVMSLYVIIESWRMPRLEHLKVHPLSVPGIVPAFIGSVLLFFGVILVVRSIGRGGHRLGWSWKGFRRILDEPGNRRLLITAFLCIVYAGFLVGTLPYGLATGLFVWSFVVVFEWNRELGVLRQWKGIVTAALIGFFSSAAITLVFERLFLVTLP